MLRVFKAKTREYIKEAIDINNIKFPWKFGGFQEQPEEGKIKGFTDWRRLINEEKLIDMTQTYFKYINDSSPLKLEKIVEHSFKSQIYKEVRRFQNQKHQMKFDIKCYDFGVYNVENIFRVGVHLGRQRNKPLELKHFKSVIDGHEFECIWKKRPFRTDKATLSLFMDISFKTIGKVQIIDDKNQKLYENDENKEELHTMRLESEIMNCNFISAKNEQPNLRDAKRMDDNLYIIDVDDYLNGNNYINFIK